MISPIFALFPAFSPPFRMIRSPQVKPLAARAAFRSSAVLWLWLSGMAHSAPASPKTEASVARHLEDRGRLAGFKFG